VLISLEPPALAGRPSAMDNEAWEATASRLARDVYGGNAASGSPVPGRGAADNRRVGHLPAAVRAATKPVKINADARSMVSGV